MDIKTIENEINNFNKKFFYETSVTVSDSIALIENNKFIIPKENYALVTELLNTTLKKFYSFDSSFKTPLLSKLDKDTVYLHQLYNKLQYSQNDIRNIFDTKFIYNSPTLSKLQYELNSLKQDYATPSQKLYKRFDKDLDKLLSIYFKKFSELFNEEKKYFQKTLLSILNSRTFYFDKLFWQAANRSTLIHKHLPKNINSTKTYIKYIMSIIHPYSDKFKALELALRIYK
jgi:hypothetical protein